MEKQYALSYHLIQCPRSILGKFSRENSKKNIIHFLLDVFSFQFTTRKDKVYFFAAETPEDGRGWLDALLIRIALSGGYLLEQTNRK